jgi:iron complex outermembrane receptor protein
MNRIALAVKLALGLAMLVPPSLALADTAADAGPLDEIVVTGIRYSLKESLATKRDSTNVVEVVTAEDIGKLPDKNVADVLMRVPGVNTQSAASGEGGFDENNRVSIRGTSASLTQTTINGHSVATGDWFINDQYATAGRSVSYDLLPSEIVARTVVTKTQDSHRSGAVHPETRALRWSHRLPN